MSTTVINIRDAPRGWRMDSRYVYIGRTPRIGKSTFWGNPYIIGKDGTREEVLAKFRNKPHLTLSSFFFRRFVKHDLKDKILICHCKPEDCHGDIYVEWADSQD